MVVGDGDIAKVLPDRDDYIWFASGVSNSLETRDSEFRTEKDLLFTFADEREKKLIYFSTLSTLYKDSPYTRHKRKMEQYVKMWPNHCIVRIGNIEFGNNPHTIINFFKDKIKRGEPFEIQDEYRYLTSKEEFLYWLNMIPDWNIEMNIPGRRMKVQQIIDEINEGKL